MRMVDAPLGTANEIHAVRAALQAFLNARFPEVTPGRWSEHVVVDISFADREEAVVSDLLGKLNEVSEFLDPKRQDYGIARRTLFEISGAIFGGGIASWEEIHNIEVVLPAAKAA